jgi:hypothetical protein
MKKLLLLTLLSFAALLSAQTESLQENGIPIRQGLNIEWSRAADSVSGGVVYVWSDTERGGRDVYAQKMDASGNQCWDGDTTTEGIQPVLVDGKANRQEDPVIITTSDGGTVIVWIDFNLDSNGDVFAQKLDANGQKLWAVGGVPLCRNTEIQNNLNIVPDANGGAYVVWEDNRGVGVDIYGSHISGDGAIATGWNADGNQLAGGNGTQSTTTFWNDTTGGAVLAYVDNTNQNYTLHAMHISPDGTIG